MIIEEQTLPATGYNKGGPMSEFEKNPDNSSFGNSCPAQGFPTEGPRQPCKKAHPKNASFKT